jgi:hypothetical protein
MAENETFLVPYDHEAFETGIIDKVAPFRFNQRKIK